MVLKVFFLHLYKIVEALALWLLLHSKNHFSHLFAFELIKAPSIFLDHGIA